MAFSHHPLIPLLFFSFSSFFLPCSIFHSAYTHRRILKGDTDSAWANLTAALMGWAVLEQQGAVWNHPPRDVPRTTPPLRSPSAFPGEQRAPLPHRVKVEGGGGGELNKDNDDIRMGSSGPFPSALIMVSSEGSNRGGEEGGFSLWLLMWPVAF